MLFEYARQSIAGRVREHTLWAAFADPTDRSITHVVVGRRLLYLPPGLSRGNYWVAGHPMCVAKAGVEYYLMPLPTWEDMGIGLHVSGANVLSTARDSGGIDGVLDGPILDLLIEDQLNGTAAVPTADSQLVCSHPRRIRVVVKRPVAAPRPAPVVRRDAAASEAAAVVATRVVAEGPPVEAPAHAAPVVAVQAPPRVHWARAAWNGVLRSMSSVAWKFMYGDTSCVFMAGDVHCPHCNAKFSSAPNAARHMIDKHDDRDMSVFPHVCKVCNKVLDNAHALGEHAKSHKAEKRREERAAPRVKKVPVPAVLPPAPTPVAAKLAVVPAPGPAAPPTPPPAGPAAARGPEAEPELADPDDPDDGRPVLRWPRDERKLRKRLRELFPHASIQHGRRKGRHPWHRVCSEGAHIEAAHKLAAHHPGVRFTDNGSNRSRVTKAHADWWGCCPNILPEDAARHVKYERRSPCVPAPGATWCKCRSQDCTHKPNEEGARGNVFVYSAWYFTDEELAAFARAGPCYAVVLDYTGPAGALARDEGHYRVRHDNGGLFVEVVVNGNNAPYRHRLPSWQYASGAVVAGGVLNATTVSDYGEGGRLVQLTVGPAGPIHVNPGPALTLSAASTYGVIYAGRATAGAAGALQVHSTMEAVAGLLSIPSSDTWVVAAILAELTTYALSRPADNVDLILLDRAREAYNRVAWPDDLRARSVCATAEAALRLADAERTAFYLARNAARPAKAAAQAAAAAVVDAPKWWHWAALRTRALIATERARWLAPYAPLAFAFFLGVALARRRTIMGIQVGFISPLNCAGSWVAAALTAVATGSPAAYLSTALSGAAGLLSLGGMPNADVACVVLAAPAWEEALKRSLPSPSWMNGFAFGAFEAWIHGQTPVRLAFHTATGALPFEPAVWAHLAWNCQALFWTITGSTKVFADVDPKGFNPTPEEAKVLFGRATDEVLGDARAALPAVPDALTRRFGRISSEIRNHQLVSQGLPVLVDYCAGIPARLNARWRSAGGVP